MSYAHAFPCAEPQHSQRRVMILKRYCAAYAGVIKHKFICTEVTLLAGLVNFVEEQSIDWWCPMWRLTFIKYSFYFRTNRYIMRWISCVVMFIALLDVVRKYMKYISLFSSPMSNTCVSTFATSFTTPDHYTFWPVVFMRAPKGSMINRQTMRLITLSGKNVAS